MAATELILLVAGITAIGVLAQLLADRLQIPTIIFYIGAGLLLGPISGYLADSLPFLGGRIIDPASFGDALPAIVGLSVAIIVFEGAFHLRVERIREAPAAALRVVTVGALIALLGTAIAVRFALGASWALSLTIGALLTATGPTVVTPILDIVPVRDRVAATLETEGIVNDVSAAILAVVFFEIVNPADDFEGLLHGFAGRLGIGLFFGVVVAGVLYYLVRYVDLAPGDAPRNARLLVLAGALVAYASANSVASEAGVAAVATAGFLLGNADIPYEEDIEDFKGDITLIVLSFVFITLAALLEFSTLRTVGLAGVAVVVIIALVLRPLLIFISTVGDRFTLQERTFMSLVGPRGIIPASVATLFAVQLRSEGLPEEASLLLGVVFLAILLTAIFEGGLARYIAEYLDVIPMRVIIVGGGKVGRSLAERLEDRGENIVIIEKNQSVVESARNAGYTVEYGDGADTDTLRAAGADNAKIVAAATGDDDVNLLVSQLASSKFDVERVIARANNPDNVEAFEDLGVRTISSSMATAWAMDNQIERPAIANWMTDIGHEGDVQEVEVCGGTFVGKPINEIGSMLPEACLIALVTRDGETTVPTADFVIEKGDMITLLGRRESVREGMQMVDSPAD
ncbi:MULTISPECIES: cation:proton antiporter domain-containing protein [Halomicrobium]|uniref:TrkA-N domain protein n=2 Tax=Halomicrobium mukohataei TaxID=57705 RepID=C7NZW2_HALMD|nr:MULTISPECIES: cation:proton antiporter [Halomicrobium]ACV46870.1 TrkA-N domain protein [Halomicrobium mukohataei DSM 12286]QCD65371.1 potassium transporter [Halomicrobium mukohataei]QFR20177.1 potassium transporter [Halomicrobium sp. ZPS1]